MGGDQNQSWNEAGTNRNGGSMWRGISYSQDISVLIETTSQRQTVPEINAHPILTCRELLELHGFKVAASGSSRIATRAVNRAQGCDKVLM